MQAVLVGQTNSPKTRGECTQNVCPTLCHSSQHRNFTQTWPHAHMMPFAGTPTTALKPQPALLSNTCMRAMLRIHGTPLHNRCSCQLYSFTSQPCSYLAASTHTHAHTHTRTHARTHARTYTRTLKFNSSLPNATPACAATQGPSLRHHETWLCYWRNSRQRGSGHVTTAHDKPTSSCTQWI